MNNNSLNKIDYFFITEQITQSRESEEEMVASWCYQYLGSYLLSSYSTPDFYFKVTSLFKKTARDIAITFEYPLSVQQTSWKSQTHFCTQFHGYAYMQRRMENVLVVCAQIKTAILLVRRKVRINVSRKAVSTLHSKIIGLFLSFILIL